MTNSDSDVTRGLVYYYDEISPDEEPKSIIYITSDDDADEVTQPVADNINTENHQQNLPARQQPNDDAITLEAENLIGHQICKEWNSIKYTGNVAAYNPERRWFRIEYHDDEESEDMDRETVLKYLVHDQPCDDQPSSSSRRIATRARKNRRGGSKKKGCGKRKKEDCGSSSPIARRTRSKRYQNVPYVPLAYTQKKRHDYIWY